MSSRFAIARSYALHFSWVVSLLATAASLFFSEVMKLPPCVLCWYQRIAMYPLIWILAVGILKEDSLSKIYAMGLSIVGWLLATYHVALYYGFISESLSPCQQGISCTSKQIEWFGFLTIPLLSWIAFVLINISLFLSAPLLREPKKEFL